MATYLKSVMPCYNLLKKAGQSSMRSNSGMFRVHRAIPGPERLLEYEVLPNTVCPNNEMRQYNVFLFGYARLFNVLKLYTCIAAQGQIVRSLLFVSDERIYSGVKPGEKGLTLNSKKKLKIY